MPSRCHNWHRRIPQHGPGPGGGYKAPRHQLLSETSSGAASATPGDSPVSTPKGRAPLYRGKSADALPSGALLKLAGVDHALRVMRRSRLSAGAVRRLEDLHVSVQHHCSMPCVLHQSALGSSLPGDWEL